MLGFLGRDLQPVAVEVLGHAGETPDRVQREVDGVVLDVGNRMHQHRAAQRRGRRAACHFGVHAQFRALRVAGQGGARQGRKFHIRVY
ncbi:hypothetical protein D3C71_1941760 [compost metagenome]